MIEVLTRLNKIRTTVCVFDNKVHMLDLSGNLFEVASGFPVEDTVAGLIPVMPESTLTHQYYMMSEDEEKIRADVFAFFSKNKKEIEDFAIVFDDYKNQFKRDSLHEFYAVFNNYQKSIQ